MNQLIEWQQKIDQLTLRERLSILLVISAVLVFLWWMFFAESRFNMLDEVNQNTQRIHQNNFELQQSINQLKQKLSEGIGEEKRQRLVLLERQLNQLISRVSDERDRLIPAEEILGLMQKMIYRESGLKLLSLKQQSIEALLQPADDSASGPPEDQIYRHNFQLVFSGKYQQIVSYLQRLENMQQRVLWNGITLQLEDYSTIKVSLDLATLSTSSHWVGF